MGGVDLKLAHVEYLQALTLGGRRREAIGEFLEGPGAWASDLFRMSCLCTRASIARSFSTFCPEGRK